MLYNFIVCEDNEKFNEWYQSVIKNVGKKLKIEYKIHSFLNYSDDLKNLIYDNNIENKIYILDLSMPIKTGDEIADIIRETDLVSFIIFITSYHAIYEETIVNGEYFYLKYINKSDKFEEILSDTLLRSIQKKKNIETLKIEIKNQFFQIVPNEITYICTENRKISIHNIYDDCAIIPTSLNYMISLLTNNFMFSKNCCLVNIKRISNIDKNNKIIYFDNGDKTNLVSRLYLKKIIKVLKN